jgi:hypothetical protein
MNNHIECQSFTFHLTIRLLETVLHLRKPIFGWKVCPVTLVRAEVKGNDGGVNDLPSFELIAILGDKPRIVVER